jgi:hypothetical protein
MKPKTLPTELRIEQYQLLMALLATWEQQPADVQAQQNDYILELRKKTRQVRNYITNRSDAASDLLRKEL